MAAPDQPDDDGEGKAEGEAEARSEIARSLLASKMSLNRIVAITGLSLAEVKRLAAEERR